MRTVTKFCLTLLILLHPYVQLAEDEPARKPTREGLFAIYETAAGYDITPYEISETINEINETQISNRQYKRILKGDDLTEQSRASLTLGWQAAFRGEFDVASEFFRTNIEISKSLDDEVLLATAYLYYGFSLFQSLDYESALDQFESSKQISESAGFRNMNAVAKALIAENHLLNGRFKDAASGFTSALEIFGALDFDREVAVMKVELAEINLRKGETESAMPLLNDARQTFLQINDHPMAAVATRDIGLIHYKERRYESAVKAFRESLSYSDELSVAKLLRDTYLKLYTISSLLQNHELSNSYHMDYIAIRDSIEDVETSRVASSQLIRKELLVRDKITELIESTMLRSYDELSAEELAESQAALEEEIDALQNEKIIEDLSAAKRKSDLLSIEREERIEQLKREKALQESALSKKELELNRQQTVRNTLFIIAFFTAILAVLLYSRFRQQKASNMKLNDAYSELTSTHRQLVDTQEQLVHQKKLASLGTMATGLAHEIQNPLNFVKNFSELSLELVNEVRRGETDISSAGPLIEDNLKKINEHGSRAENIVKGMLSRSASDSESATEVNINELLKEITAQQLQNSELKKSGIDTKTVFRFDKDIPTFKIFKNELQEAISNILHNALHFMYKRYRSDDSGSYTPELKVNTSFDKGSIMISITDNGTGIPQEILDKIFDPFFTTKKGKEGSGLGLSATYKIITERHDGGIHVESTEGKFCRFIINLPLHSN